MQPGRHRCRKDFGPKTRRAHGGELQGVTDGQQNAATRPRGETGEEDEEEEVGDRG